MGDLAPGTSSVIDGRYRLLAELAAGGRGTTYLAEHMLLGGWVAVDVMHADLAADPETVTRFLDRALATCALRHPNLVETTDTGVTGDGAPFVAYEHLTGTRLTEEIYELGGLLPRRAVRIALQIASALEAAHGVGIWNLPLSADDVFLGQRDGAPDHVKMVGFGLPRTAPELLAPEQLEQPENADKRADVYALGALLYEMLTARRPHTADDDATLAFRIVYEPAPPLGILGVPEELERLILFRMLCKTPCERLASMAEVRRELEAILEAMSFAIGSSPSIRRVARGSMPPPGSGATWPPYGIRLALFESDDDPALDDAPPAGSVPLFEDAHPTERMPALQLEAVMREAAAAAAGRGARAETALVPARRGRWWTAPFRAIGALVGRLFGRRGGGAAADVS